MGLQRGPLTILGGIGGGDGLTEEDLENLGYGKIVFVDEFPTDPEEGVLYVNRNGQYGGVEAGTTAGTFAAGNLAAYKTDLPLNVKHFGAVGDNVANDTAAIKAAIAAAVSGRAILDFGANKTYKITERLDIPVGLAGYVGQGVTLECSGVPDSDGFAVRFVPAANTFQIYSYWNEGIRILGPLSESRNLDGVYIGRPAGVSSGDVAGAGFNNFMVRGFRDNWVFGDQSWLFGFFQCASTKAWRRGINVDAVTNAGENYNFHGGVVADCSNAGGTAIGLYTGATGNAGVAFFGTSFDYNNKQMVLQSGNAAFNACHLEDRNAGTMVDITTTSGQGPTKVDFNSCVFAGTEQDESGVGGSTVIPGGRDSFISIAGDRSVVRIRGGSWDRYDSPNSELVTVVSGSPLVSIEHVDPVVQSNAAPKLAAATSLIENGGFENGLGDWRLLTTTNFIRNNSFVGAVVGSPGTRPDGWAFAGSANGLTLEIVSIDSGIGGVPTLTIRLSGTPSASGTYGFALENNAIPAAAGQTWTHSVNVRRAAATMNGLNGISLAIQERNSGGSTLQQTAASFTPTYRRQRISQTRSFTEATTAFAVPTVQLAYTNGVAVDATIAIDLPMLTLQGDPLVDTFTSSAFSTIPTPRHRMDTTNKAAGTQALAITNGGTGNYGLFRLVPVKPGGRLLVRGQVRTTDASAGSAGFQVEWLNGAGTIIGSAVTVGTLLASGSTGFGARGGSLTVPAGASSARVYAWSQALNGAAQFDDVAAWAI